MRANNNTEGVLRKDVILTYTHTKKKKSLKVSVTTAVATIF